MQERFAKKPEIPGAESLLRDSPGHWKLHLRMPGDGKQQSQAPWFQRMTGMHTSPTPTRESTDLPKVLISVKNYVVVSATGTPGS